jgi:enoyl-[acyl-carrier protein] reductase II
VAAAGTDTVTTAIFGRHEPAFNPMRVLRNQIVQEWAGREDEVPADNSAEPLVGRFDLMGQQVEVRRFSFLVPMRDATTGDLDQMALLSGQGVGLVRSVEPAAEVITRMVDEAAAMLARYAPAPGAA